MQLGLIGLGKMGDFMNQRLLNGGHQTVVYDRGEAAVQTAAGYGSTPSTSLADMVGKLNKPRAIWLMIPAGAPTESTIEELMGVLNPATPSLMAATVTTKIPSVVPRRSRKKDSTLSMSARAAASGA